MSATYLYDLQEFFLMVSIRTLIASSLRQNRLGPPQDLDKRLMDYLG